MYVLSGGVVRKYFVRTNFLQNCPALQGFEERRITLETPEAGPGQFILFHHHR
jgi:hypothetical protein